ncbi:hypothetical protein GDO81_017439 [Engystomops pustulosus]|uniref:Uncharacterized protein n=1 Tax=Engystomops pustulosus TaxID=76066 RepID=A0AAV7ALY0_ENGPU|nr:hypothetical protein GDO81_017439 [Engystomops pustulosus]
MLIEPCEIHLTLKNSTHQGYINFYPIARTVGMSPPVPPSIHGVQGGNTDHTFSLHADDIILLLTHLEDSLTSAMDLIQIIFGNFS